ncbi:hypothetical protein EVC02_031 [Rhizobium phage RHph_N17]|nr:hypothetical protein EVC02_031 [Rhizobium phage RHph_N17]
MANILDETIEAEAVPVDVLRQSAGAYVHGEWVPGVETPETITATVQPVTGKELRDMEEGVRNEARFSLWTRSAIATDEFVIYGGSKYRVMTSIPRPEGGFTKAILGLTNS